MIKPREIPGTLMQALALHQQGKLDEARVLYQVILKAQPGNFDAMQLLGTIALQTGNPAHAVEMLKAALRINGNHAGSHNNLGNALKELGRIEEAVTSYRCAATLKPDFTEAHNNLGIALKQMGKLNDAIASFDQAVATRPSFAEGWNNRGVVLKELGRLEEAASDFERAATFRPDYAEAWHNRGVALKELGRFKEAAADFDRAIALRPDYAEAWNNRGVVFKELERHADAIACYDRAIALRPDYAIALCNRGTSLQETRRLDAALADLDRALAIRPDYPEAFYNRGIVLKEMRRYEEALVDYDRAIALQPDDPDTWNNRGTVLQELMRLDDALASFSEALRLKPEFAGAQWNLSLLELLLGRYREGWARYEWRWQKRDDSIREHRQFAQPLWLGEQAGGSLAGKTILLYAEQGLGDALQFCRYAKSVAALGARVILEVHAPLIPLLKELEGVSQIVAIGDALPDFDCQCPLLSLPLAFATTLDTIPVAPRYLQADPHRITHWQARCGPRSKPRIGLAWSGNVEHLNDHQRSARLEQVAPLLTLDGEFEFFSLQKEIRAIDQPVLQAHPALRHFGGVLCDFADTAALCELMDVVISVDTSIAHLAGALGKPVWIMLPFSPDWRWLLDRDDSPWYPSAQLYRQQRIGDWSGVVDRIRTDLSRSIVKEWR